MDPVVLAAELQPILDGASKLKDSISGYDHVAWFRKPVPRTVPGYYEVIKRPVAFSDVRANLKAATYRSVHEFLVDMAQIVYNAYCFNPPGTVVYKDTKILERYLKSRVSEMEDNPRLADQNLTWPDLGPIPELPPVDAIKSESPLVNDDSSDDARGGRRRRPLRQTVLLGRRKREEEEDSEVRDVNDGRKRRGRPPTVDKPHEHRIKNILRAVRRDRDESGRLRATEFEKIPAVPSYTQKIRNPIAIDTIRKNIKRRAYTSVDEFVRDMNQIFDNARTFMGDDVSLVSQDAIHLQQVLAAAAEEELQKPDSAYADPDSGSKTSRLPLDEIEHRGELYHVGDWVHISNPNDPAKPTIGQIFRMWQENGQQWINACWYYRPEQTVHRYDKVFYENEVVKSGQYRDHLVDDILEKCFVMYITKYQRGRPKDIGNHSVYLCESRYNENEKTFNKIRTWKACIPDEVRSTDYPMDLFAKPRHLRRVASPLKNTLPSDARDDDPIPDPVMGAANAPPIRGAVYKRPVDPNDPPEEPDDVSIPQETSRAQSPAVGVPSKASESPAFSAPQSMKMQMSRQQSIPPDMHQSSRAGHSSNSGMPLPSGQHGVPPGGIGPPLPTAFMLPPQVSGRLPQEATAGISKLRDGQILWFPACPVWISRRLDVDPIGTPKGPLFDAEGEMHSGQRVPRGLGHSAEYLAWKAKKGTSNV